MSKKLIPAVTALALAAFVLPQTASASPRLTHPTGSTLSTGVKILGTGAEGQRLTDTSGNTLLECPAARITGTLTKNNGTEIEGNIESATFEGTGANLGGDWECTGTFGNVIVDTNIGNGTPWCLRATGAMSADEFQIRGGYCSEAARSITFVLTSTTIGTCKYSRTSALKGTLTTHSIGDAILVLSGSGATGGEDSEFSKEEGGFLCPVNGTLDMAFTLETDTTSGSDRLYVS